MRTCPLCGEPLSDGAAGPCASCPLGAGCALICCRACGYSAIDPNSSTLVRLARRITGFVRSRRRELSGAAVLADVRPGRRARIAALEELPPSERDRLLAYGLAPGRVVQVIQATPVTVVRVEHTELALERVLSRTIGVVALAASTPGETTSHA